MMRWKTDKIVEDLKLIPGIHLVLSDRPGGDYDSDRVIATITPAAPGVDPYSIYVSGYEEDTSVEPTEPSNDKEVYYIVVSDGGDSRGGCNSDEEEHILPYHAIRRYFSKQGATVIDSEDEIF